MLWIKENFQNLPDLEKNIQKFDEIFEIIILRRLREILNRP